MCPERVCAPPELAQVAEQVFGERVGLAERFAWHLSTTGVERGLLGPRETERIWDRHLLNCALVHRLVPAGCDVVDVGSGAGLPGIALAIARPDLSVRLVEPLIRRTTWLDEVVSALGLTTVAVDRGRAEDVARASADVVTARAVAGLPQLAAWCLPLLRRTGVLLAMKGESAREELMRSVGDLESLGGVAWDVCDIAAPGVSRTYVVRVAVGDGRGMRSVRSGGGSPEASAR